MSVYEQRRGFCPDSRAETKTIELGRADLL